MTNTLKQIAFGILFPPLFIGSVAFGIKQADRLERNFEKYFFEHTYKKLGELKQRYQRLEEQKLRAKGELADI